MKTTVKKVFIFQVQAANLRRKKLEMTDTRKHDDAALVSWTYSHDEWKNFIRWKKRKRGVFHYLLHLATPSAGIKIPGITISSTGVSMDNLHESFQNDDRELQRVRIRDADEMNIMEIIYQRNDLRNPGRGEIHILVPKGRLKEAIGVEDKLNKMRNTIL